MSLVACAVRPKTHPEPTVLFRKVEEKPSAELLVCADRPEGFSGEAWAVLPPGVRVKLVEVLKAFKANADRQDRLINWTQPGSC